jgi:uncharacterized iron-regulated membrane protein
MARTFVVIISRELGHVSPAFDNTLPRMTHLTALWLFFLLVAGIVALPGLDMTFVLAGSLTSGRRGGFAAIAGIVAGGIVHVAMATLGIAVILQVMPKAFNALLLADASTWPGSAGRSSAAASPSTPRRTPSAPGWPRFDAARSRTS